MLPNYAAEHADSWLEGALTRFSADNDELVAPTRALLAHTIADARRHARLLNTLSMLEHMGSYKIMSTQHAPCIDQATLRHVAEEAHHAYFMKRQAEKTAAQPLEYVPGDLLAPAAARMYFERLEAALIRTLAGAGRRAVYLYMSMIVEFRALWFYELYHHALQRAQHALSLKRVLGEEQNHLSEIAARLDRDGERSDARVREFLDHEKRLYNRLLAAMQRAAS